MTFYKKKPIVIEAYRYGYDEIPLEWLENPSIMHHASYASDYLLITTLEGEMKAFPGDYIIKGIEGEFYPCKESIFLATYDEEN